VGAAGGLEGRAERYLDVVVVFDEGGKQDGKEQMVWECLELKLWTSGVAVEEPEEMRPPVIYGGSMRTGR
jgi:hypothetical protein